MADHTLSEQAFERFRHIQIAAIAQGPGEEPRIEQVQHRVFDPADILVDGHPILRRGAIEGRTRTERAEANEIPGRIDKGVERVGFALRRFAADRAVDMLPGRMVVQRIAGLVEGDIFRQRDGQIRLRHRHSAAIRAMDHRHRAAPVTLARHTPVAQPVIDGAFAGAHLDQPVDGGTDRARHVESVQELGIDQRAVAGIGLVADRVGRRILFRRADDGNDVEPIFTGELQIALIVTGAAEDRAGAVFHQHEIGDIDR